MYKIILLSHTITAFISIILFFGRGMLLFKSKINKFKYTTYFNDTILALSGIYLWQITSSFENLNSWLTIKIYLIILYVGLGIFSFRSSNLILRIVAWVSALLIGCYIIFIAFNKHFWLSTI
jgi:uncharacterized membrane protein SirB2